MILNGEYRDTEAVLEGIDEKKFSATLTLDSVSTEHKRSRYSVSLPTALFPRLVFFTRTVIFPKTAALLKCLLLRLVIINLITFLFFFRVD